jgi:beta-glucosidase/6-phospho-beta-glucosidase/beta-galactosidase
MADRSVLPEGFHFGVATAGFQIEGGYNGPGEPANNWGAWERSGRVEPSGIALDFWNRYEEQLDRVRDMGCDSFRLSVEWTRCEPEEARVDVETLGRYAAILDACHQRRLHPVVTLHHFTHPNWLGEDFWLRGDSPERFAAWVELALEHLSERCSTWITLNELNVVAILSYLVGAFPPGRRRDVGATLRSLDNLLTAHVLAYRAIHRRQPDAVVGTNNSCSSLYELDRMLIDILLARSLGVGRHDLDRWLAEHRSGYYASVPPTGGRGDSLLEAALRRLTASIVPLDRALPRAVAAVYDGADPRPLDVVQLDYYEPVASHQLRIPGHRTAGGRGWQPMRNLWDDRPDPDGLRSYCAANHQPGLDLWIVENGLCNRVRRGRSYPRLDGWDRTGYLRANLAAVVAAIDDGIPVSGYWHWTLADNYEWGSYEPRFGLFGVDRERGVRWSDDDSMGDDSAGAYGRIISGLRQGDRCVLA